MSLQEQNLSILQSSDHHYLQKPDYNEYKTLKRHDFSGQEQKEPALILFHIFLSCLVYIGVAIYSRHPVNVLWILPLLILIPYPYLITWGFVTLCHLNRLYFRLYPRFAIKSRKYKRFKALEAYYVPIEEEQKRLEKVWKQRERDAELKLEQETILAFEALEAQIGMRRREIETISSDLKYKRKWRSEFDGYEDLVIEAKEFLASAKSFINERLYRIKFDTINNSKFASLRWRLSDDLDQCDFLLWRITRIEGYIAPVRQARSQLIYREESTDTPIPRPDEPYIDKIIDLGQSIFIPCPDPEIETIDDEQTVPFHDSSALPENGGAIPKQRKKSKRFRIVRLSREFYADLEGVRADVGERGELMALDFERQRVFREEGAEFVERVIHASATEGDGLGYDIRSYKNGEEIYIEVKTTIKTFWANLFFTRTEYETMLAKSEQYQLMRIWEFDVTTCLGEFRIFDGADAINSTFKFDPNIYTLNQKST